MTALQFTFPTGDAIIQMAAVLVALGVIYRYVAKPLLAAATKATKFIDDMDSYGPTLFGIAAEFKTDAGSSLKDTIDALSDAATAAKTIAESVAVSTEAHEKMHEEFVRYQHAQNRRLTKALKELQSTATTNMKARTPKKPVKRKE